MRIETDILVIGSGIAGLSFALKAAKAGTVAVVTKRVVRESATFYAQGGIASVLSAEDSFDAHIRDTVGAGAGLCDEGVVEFVVRDGPKMIHELMDLGVKFSTRNCGKEGGHEVEGDEGREGDRLDLGKEGGHTKRRIVHAADFTGKAVEEALTAAVAAEPKITVYEDHIAVDLITHTKFVGPSEEETVWGAYALDQNSGAVHTFASKLTVLATGGAGKVYIYTSNPDVATGDGIAMAYRAGAEVLNMEFIQFHPTCLYHPRAKSFLLSEAIRGEGGVLKLQDGTQFMKKHHHMADLAPRDIVARAIDFELKKSGDECVYLDISFRDAGFIKERFPNIYNKCLEFGFDMTKEPLPVVPAAHYICGGVRSGREGRSTIKRLYAIGEAACTGLHGANRLASNSLLEALVYAETSSKDAVKFLEDDSTPPPRVPQWETGGAVTSDEAVVISQNWDEIRTFMWNYVGIVRSNKRLERARRRIELLKQEINEYYWNFTITGDLLEMRNIATVAELIIMSAESRKESRGLHYNIDYPERDDKNFKRDTVIKAGRVSD